MSRHRHVFCILSSICCDITSVVKYIHALCHCVPKWILFNSWLSIPDMSVHIRHSCQNKMWLQLFAQQALGDITFVYKFAYRQFSFAFNIYIVFITKSFSPDIKQVKGYSPWSTEMAFSRVPTSPKREEYYLCTNGWKRISCLHSQDSLTSYPPGVLIKCWENWIKHHSGKCSTALVMLSCG